MAGMTVISKALLGQAALEVQHNFCPIFSTVVLRSFTEHVEI